LSMRTKKRKALVKEDFELYEQGGVITDFELIRGGSDSREMSVCFVMDVSGSMSGGAMEDAKSAAENFLMSAKDNFRAGLVKFSGQGEIVSPVTESMGVLTRGIDSLSAAGGTNIADGLRVGIQVLKGCEGAPVIILLSDGADSHTYAIEEIKQQLAEQGIRVYAVGVGNADGDYLKGIADATGGKYIQASDSMELGQVYHRIRQYLYNDFIIRFTVVTDQDNYRRNARLRLREDSYDEEDYIVGVPEDEILTEEQKGILVDFYEQIGGSGKGGRADDYTDKALDTAPLPDPGRGGPGSYRLPLVYRDSGDQTVVCRFLYGKILPVLLYTLDPGRDPAGGRMVEGQKAEERRM